MKSAERDKLIVALDVPGYEQARQLVEMLGRDVSFFKIGLELLFAGGLDLAAELKRGGKRVFLDMKLLDIGNTVEKAVATAAGLGVDFLTIHGVDGKTLAAAVRGRGSSKLKLLAVTVLTSLDARDLSEQGVTGFTPQELVLKRAQMAERMGFDGAISSGQEAGAIRALTGPEFLIVTPGIRLPGGDAGDQMRITTPEDALRAGANHLVVGRPINAAADPKAAAAAFHAAIARSA